MYSNLMSIAALEQSAGRPERLRMQCWSEVDPSFEPHA